MHADLHTSHRSDESSHARSATLRCAVVPVAAPGRLADLIRLVGSGTVPDVEDEPLALPVLRVRAEAPLLNEGGRADTVYVVRSGSFKCSRTSLDGYEQVLAFRGSGELLGFEALFCGHQPFGVVALDEASVFALPLRDLDTWRQHSPALARTLQFAASRQLASAGELAEMMAAVAAEVRLARFLVWLSRRMAEQGQSPQRLHLRMSRRDIASLLGVAHETVSRSFGVLADAGYVRVNHRDVEIIDMAGLLSSTRATRGTALPRRRTPPAAARPGLQLRSAFA